MRCTTLRTRPRMLALLVLACGSYTAVSALPPPARDSKPTRRNDTSASTTTAESDRRQQAELTRAEASFRQGNYWRSKGEVAKACDCYKQAIDISPKHHAAKAAYERYEDALRHISLGRSYSKSAEREKAIAEFSQALAREPILAAAYMFRGDEWSRMGLRTLAVADYTHAIGISPDTAMLHSRRSYEWQQLGKLPKAIADCKKASEVNPAKVSGIYPFNTGLYISTRTYLKRLEELKSKYEAARRGRN